MKDEITEYLGSLFIKLFKIKTSAKSLFEQFMPLVRPELETCPVCDSSGNLHVHCYYKRYLIDFIGGKCVRHEVTVLSSHMPIPKLLFTVRRSLPPIIFFADHLTMHMTSSLLQFMMVSS